MILKLIRSPFVLTLVATAAASLLVVQASDAAFTGTTENAGNGWAAGTVSLTDNDADSAKFSATNWKPTDTETQCIEVTYTGSVMPAAAVKLYASVADTDSGAGGTGNALKLSDDLDVVVNIYAATETCATASPTKTAINTGTLLAVPADYATGISSGWTPAAQNEKRAFEFTVTLGDDTANDAQGDSAEVTFTWEAQS